MVILPNPRRIIRRPKVTVCGSFNRHLREVQLAIEELQDEGAIVLSPQRALPWKVIEENFLLLEGDKPWAGVLCADGSVRRTEDRHLSCIKESDFVLIVCPDGYVGNSTAFEIGVAIACGVPLYTLHRPHDPRIADHLICIQNIRIAVLNHCTNIIGA